MRRNIKHHTDEGFHIANRQHQKNGSHKANQEEYLFDSEADSEASMKARKKYNRNQQKRMYLHKLH